MKSRNKGVLGGGTAHAKSERLEQHLDFIKTGPQVMRQISQGMLGSGKEDFMEQVFA